MTKVSELKQKKVALLGEARSLAEVAVAESRSLSQDEQNKIDSLTKEIDGLNVTISAAEDIEKRTREIATVEVATDSADAETGAEYRSVFETYVRHGKDALTREQIALLQAEQRSDTIMVKGTGNVGGYTVPTSFLPQLVQKLEQVSPVYNLAKRIETASGEDLQVPTDMTHAASVWVAENAGAFDSESDTFGQVTLKSYLNAFIAKLSVQLLQDSAIDLQALLAQNIGKAIGRGIGASFSVGASNSTTTPQGLVTSANATTLGTGNSTSFAADDVIDLVHTVTPPYRNGAVFLMHDETVGFVRKLKDSNDRYLWSTGYGDIAAGSPDSLLGYAVYSDVNMDTLAASKTVVGFGNVEDAYLIRQAGQFSIRRLDERFADLFLVAFLAYMRVDGKLVDSNAFQTLKTSAT